MLRALRYIVVAAALLVSLPGLSSAGPITIDFEGFTDSVSVGATIPGLTFTNATVLQAGVSLNEFEFPPVSGSNVTFDDGGPMRIDFARPVYSVSGHTSLMRRP
jgi:hypothetical protein